MLNRDTLQQLKQLKRDIEAAKERAEGIVRGSQRRFGFVRLDDGRDVFLPPEQMDRVLPGDRVAIVVNRGDDDKLSGEIEKLLDSPLSTFTGSYVTRGQAHFVEPDLPRFGKLLFLPPAERKKAQPGDLISCQLKRHPFRDGRAQAQILKRIGKPEQPGIEADYTIAKLGLPCDWSEQALATELLDRCAEQREDLTDLPFVTIDASETRDIDDALYAEATTEGWRVVVAVADPSAFIAAGSALEQAACERGTTVYMPGKVLPMLPDAVSAEGLSLVEGAERAAIVCDMQVGADGDISSYRFSQARIRSRAKLSYSEVAAHLGGDSSLPHASLELLFQAHRALLARRREQHLVIADKPEFRLMLNEQRKIEQILRVERNDAHKLVEECMVAANRCAADWLRDEAALFMTHSGIREDRVDNVKAVLAEALPELAETNFTELAGYVALVKAIEASDSELPLRSIVSRMLERGLPSAELLPHHGMGFECYTTFTSPLRKYGDFLVHRCLRAKLQGEPLPVPDADTLEALQAKVIRARQASNQVERWLKCQYMADKQEQHFAAHILHVSGGGFTVQLDDSGIQGFVDARSIEGKLSFDPNFLRLSNDQRCYQLDQPVTVKLDRIDELRRSINFQLVESEPASTAS